VKFVFSDPCFDSKVKGNQILEAERVLE